ncbi:MAG TPA: response regulator [Lacunisphaera sp.]|nr:response regulator [Lacunisphaera sp.]
MKPLKRILLVEDSLNDIELTLDALAEHHLANEVVVTRDGAEAMDYLLRQGAYAGRDDGPPAVVLLDIKMPKLSGIEVLRQMKTNPMLKTVPVVILTSSKEEPDLITCYQLGVNAYVVKPVDFQQFVNAVKQVGAFWAVLNEPPPEGTNHPFPALSP